ncbi:beta-lactamase-like protein [Terfezia claveryi]|nr:beta-lactamase-like protein [Terfezia claveryi]
MFHFTPLLGTQSDSHAHSSLLELDGGIKILVDVGWDEKFDVGMLKAIEKVTPQLSLILLTHPTISHIGAYAHCCKYIPFFTTIPVYSTFPISALGRLLLTDLYLSNPLSTPRLPPLPSSPPTASSSPSSSTTNGAYNPSWLLPTPSPSEITSYFSKIHLLKYSQPHHPLLRTPPSASHHLHHPRGAGHTSQSTTVTITAYAAGHTLGGTIWKIQHSQESIVYAVSWNHTRENHLSGAAFLSHSNPSSSGVPGPVGGGVNVINSSEGLGRPTALIFSSRTTDEEFFGASKWTRKKRDEALLEVIRTVAVGRGKVVLIPTDSVARVLELVYLLEHAFRKDRHLSGDGGGSAGSGLYLVARKGRRLRDVVGSMLEWMDEGVIKDLEGAAKVAAQQEAEGGAKNQGQRGGRGGGKGKGGKSGQDAGKQTKAAGPFDFLHLKILDKPAQMERLLREYNTLSGETSGEAGDDGSATGTENETGNESDASATSMDYDPETGALVERVSRNAKKNPTRQQPQQRQQQQQRGKRRRGQEKQPRKQALKKPPRGMVIIASDASLEYGYSREIFTKIASGEGNVVILTELMDGGGNSEKGSLGEELSQAWRTGMKARKEKSNDQSSSTTIGKDNTIGVGLPWEKKQVELHERVPLKPAEVEEYKRYMAGLKKSASQVNVDADGHPTPGHDSFPYLIPLGGKDGESEDEESEDDDDESSDDSEGDSEPDKQGVSLAKTGVKSKKALAAKALKAAQASAAAASAATDGGVGGGVGLGGINVLPAATVADLGISVLLRGRGVYDFDVRGAKGRNRMLPFMVRRRRADEYGEVVKGEEYIRAEEREEKAAVDDKVGGGLGDRMIVTSGWDGRDMRERERVVERVMGRKRKWEEAGAAGVVAGVALGTNGKGGKKGKRGLPEKLAARKKKSMKRRKGNDSSASSPGRQYSDGDGADNESGDEDNEEEGEVKESSNADTDTSSDGEDDDEEEIEQSLLSNPSKVSSRKLVIATVRARVCYIDFSGLHDRRSLRMLLPLINPRKLILVSGTKSQIENMARECKELLAGSGDGAMVKFGVRGTDVLTPKTGEKVNASVDMNAWTVRLGEGLVKELRWQEVGGLGVVHVVGRIGVNNKVVKLVEEKTGMEIAKIICGKVGANGEKAIEGAKEEGKEKEKKGVDGEGDTDMAMTVATTVGSLLEKKPTQDGGGGTEMDIDSLGPPQDDPKLPPRMLEAIIPESSTTITSTSSLSNNHSSTTSTLSMRHLSTPPIHVGDIKLTDLRRVLVAAGHAAEFAGEGGALVCDGVVVVRKVGVGRVVVEDAGGGLYVGVGGAGGKWRSFVEVRRRVYEGLAVVRGGV